MNLPKFGGLPSFVRITSPVELSVAEAVALPTAV
jgi:hypothetical protein